MSKQAYDVMLAEAQALPIEKIKKPYMPVGIFNQEAEDLFVWASKDKSELAAAGLPESVLERLEVLTDANRFAQSIWMSELQSRQDAEEQWAQEAPAAFDLSDQLLHTFRYAYRNNENALGVVANIAEGSGNADMIQDLSDYGVLARKHTDELTTINFDFTLIESADKLSYKMGNLRALANGEKQEENEALTVRNQIYTLLKDTVDEVRSCGKYVFWRNKKRIIGYSSKYNRDKNH